MIFFFFLHLSAYIPGYSTACGTSREENLTCKATLRPQEKYNLQANSLELFKCAIFKFLPSYMAKYKPIM